MNSKADWSKRLTIFVLLACFVCLSACDKTTDNVEDAVQTSVDAAYGENITETEGHQEFIRYSAEDVFLNIVVNLPDGVTISDAIDDIDCFYYPVDENDSDALDLWIMLYGGYTLSESEGLEILYSNYFCDNETGQVYWECEFVSEYELDTTGKVYEVELNIAEEPEVPTAVKLSVNLPDDVTADKAIYSGPVSYIMEGNGGGISLYPGYALAASEGTEISSDQYIYWCDTDSGEVYVTYYFTVTGEKNEVSLNVVETEEEAPKAVKIDYILPDGMLANDVFAWYDDYDYILDTECIQLALTAGFDMVVSGGTAIKTDEIAGYGGFHSVAYFAYATYEIYPDTDATEIIITATELDGGILAFTGAADQIAYITSSTTGEVLSEGDKVAATDVLTIEVNRGYSVTGGSTYDSDTDDEVIIYQIIAAEILEDGVVTVNIE
ncbi:MAG: hypothetical protein LUH36_04725 [Oscillospiraceae bacterium]|nr:hypothetical protein [Oscillospiraceae bacterium]